MNQLQALAMNEGQRRKKKCGMSKDERSWKNLLAPWASRRRKDLLELLDRMNPPIEELTRVVEQEARKRPEVQRLMTHPGVGPLTALAFVLIIGTPERFKCGKQIGSDVGLIPAEDSVPAINGWVTSPGKAALYCVSYWWKQPKRQRAVMRTGDDGTCTWRCAGNGILPRWPWPEDSECGCTGCGETVGSMYS